MISHPVFPEVVFKNKFKRLQRSIVCKLVIGLKVLLCAVNSKYIHSNPAVYSLKCSFLHYCDLYNPACGRQIEIQIREFTINDAYDAVITDIASAAPDVIAFSVYLWNIEYITRLCCDLRIILPERYIILGGPEISFGTGHTSLSHENYDYIISGEGERAFYALLLWLYTGMSSACRKDCQPAARYLSQTTREVNFSDKMQVSVDGVPESFAFCVCGQTVCCAPITDLSEIPFIYNKDNIGRFRNRIVYYEASRGCPYRCAYCLSAACGKVRLLPIERVYQDIFFFYENRVGQVKFVDRTFNCIRDRAYAIIRFIAEQYQERQQRGDNPETHFHFEAAADLLDNEFIKFINQLPPGLIQFEFGIQSANKEVLEACDRGGKILKLFRNISQLVMGGTVNVHVDLIAGLPHETLALFRKSFNETYALKAHQLQLGFLKLLAGAPLNHMQQEHAYVFSKYPPYEIIRNQYLSYQEIIRLKQVEDVLERYYNSNRFSASLDYLMPYFNSPFDFYDALGQFYKEEGYLFQPISSRKMYDLLLMFADKTGSNGKFYPMGKASCQFELQQLKRNLLYDYFCSDSSDLPPESLRELWRPERTCRETAARLKQQADLFFGSEAEVRKEIKGAGYAVRFIAGNAYLFDYSKRNAVTNRYPCILIPPEYMS